jgi:hypothetical protein
MTKVRDNKDLFIPSFSSFTLNVRMPIVAAAAGMLPLSPVCGAVLPAEDLICTT